MARWRPGRRAVGTMPRTWSPATPSPAPTLLSRCPPSSGSRPPPAPGRSSPRAIEGHPAPGDIVVDLHGRGGWVARAAVDRQRRAVSMESSPLTRLLAEIVLRPPDVRHLDAAFQAPRRLAARRVEPQASRSATCSPPAARRAAAAAVIDESSGRVDDRGGGSRRSPDAAALPLHVCRDQLGGGEQRHAPVDEDDLRPGHADDVGAAAVRRRAARAVPGARRRRRARRPVLDLHTRRQLVGLPAILERIEGDLRAAPVEAALRLALLHALLPASRLNGFPGRIANAPDRRRHGQAPAGDQWRERNPWLAFEDGYRLVRGFVQRLEGGALGPAPGAPRRRPPEPRRGRRDGGRAARDRRRARSLADEAARAVGSRVQRPRDPPRPRAAAARASTRSASRPPTSARLGARPRGRGAAAARAAPRCRRSVRPGAGRPRRSRRSLEAVAPYLARDARVVSSSRRAAPEALVAAALGGVGAGYRLVGARLAEPDEEAAASSSSCRPAASLAAAGRAPAANSALQPGAGGRGDPDIVPGRGLFAPPERIDARPFSAAEAARAVTDTAVEVLQARGEPAQLRAAARRDPRRPRSRRAAAPARRHRQPRPTATRRMRRAATTDRHEAPHSFDGPPPARRAGRLGGPAGPHRAIGRCGEDP